MEIEGFQYQRLGDLLQLSRGFDITKKEQREGTIPVVSSGGISSYNSEFKCKGPGVVTGRKGTLGKVFFINKEYWPHDTTLWVKDFKGNNPKYIYYLLSQLNLQTFDVGASNPTLNRNHLHKIYVIFPKDRKTQDMIVKILDAYDDAIEVNNQRIKILEDAARDLYKEWFIRMRFPGYKQVRYVKGVPGGWMERKVREIVDRKKFGRTYKPEELKEQGIVVVVDQSVNDLVGYHDNNPDHVATLENPLIIFGDHTCKMKLMVEPFSLAENVIPISSKDQIPIFFLYYLIGSLVETTEYKRHWNELVTKSVIVGKPELQKKYAEVVKPIFEQINILQKQNNLLRQSRDRLLPRLVSGKLKIQ